MGISGVSLSSDSISFIKSILPEESTILEMGSGAGTIELSKYYKMFSIENQPEWMDRYTEYTTYINCDTKYYDNVFTKPDVLGPQTAWYNPDQLFSNLPEKYDLILIDGPGGGYGRGGFLKHIDKFNINIPIVVDDIQRPAEMDLLIKVSQYLNRPYKVLFPNKELGYILP